MKRKLVVAIGALALGISSLVACPKMQCNQGMGCNGKAMGMNKMQNHFDRFKGNVMRLDLSDSQRDAIRDLFRSCKENRPNPYDAFSDTAFDKAKYIELAKQNKNTKLERRADTMEKVYALLTPEQKKELKVVLSLKSTMMACDAKPQIKACDMKKKCNQ